MKTREIAEYLKQKYKISDKELLRCLEIIKPLFDIIGKEKCARNVTHLPDNNRNHRNTQETNL